MTSASTTHKKSGTPVSGRVSVVADPQLQQGLDAIKKGDECRDLGDFDKAKKQYEKAVKFCPSEAQDRLVILPLCRASKASMEGGDSDRFIPAGWRARAHHVKEKVTRPWKHPSSVPALQQSFFPRPSLPTQSTVASLAVCSFQSTLVSVSTCVTTSTSVTQSTAGTLWSLASGTVATELGEVSDVRSLKAAYEAVDGEARGVLEQKIYGVIKEFGQHPMTFDTVQELVGLAVILDLFPADVDLGSMQGAFVEILASLQGRLRTIRTDNNELQLMPLLSALNALLDAMVRRKVFGLDREAVYNELRTLLTGLTSNQNVMVCFQALYAKQALAIIGNDESLPMSVFRRGKLAFVLVGNVTSMATKFELANAESAYQNIKEIFDFSIQDRWYQGLIYVDYLVGQRSWWQLEDFVLRSKFQSDVCFQLGVILRLQQIAVVQTDIVVKEGAMKFLTALGDNPIPLVSEMVQSALRRLQRLPSSTGGMANPTYQGELRPTWDPAWLAVPKGILFKAVQDRDRRDATMDIIPGKLDAIHQTIQSQLSKVAQPSLDDVHSTLKTYYEQDLVILRVSGDRLDMETCFVNLAIVEAPAQREKDKQDLKEQAAVFHRIPSSEAVERVDMQTAIPLERLFDKRKLRDGEEEIPKKILSLQGPHSGRTVPGKFFNQGLDQEDGALARALALSAQQGRVLFILDGLDEIAKDTRCEDSDVLNTFLKTLLAQQHVVITSRPSGVDRTLLPTIDLELETIGFSQQNVSDFMAKVLEPEAVKRVQDFIQRTPLMQGLVNIPVQLDVICFSWDSLPTNGSAITMTGLYQLMVRKLWCKDALRLKKSVEGEILTQDHINQLDAQESDDLMAMERQHLGYLAFKGLMNDHQIEFDEKALLCAFRELKKYCTTVNNRHLPPQLLEMMKQTSFLHTADADLDTLKSGSQQAWYFLHLTFQEYFAATWVAQHFQVSIEMQEYFSAAKSAQGSQQPLPAGIMTLEQTKAFVQEHKYNPRYEIMWWMVAGLLEGKALQDFFDLLQGAPRDLIGGRHQQILASCLNEARARLDATIVTELDAELMKWLHFEIQTCHGKNDKSMLGSHSSFPETLLVRSLGLRSAPKVILLSTLGSRSTLSEAAIQSLMGALKDEDAH
ncbi:hypothetical protein BGZ70_005791, partial [Mortierella alpina]